MRKPLNTRGTGSGLARFVTCLLAALCLLFGATAAYCDPPESMAPPVAAPGGVVSDSDNVFQWNEVPQNQEAPVTRAVFDQNGYQLFDTVGETIVVPFTNNDLYVMKFAVSATGDMYFVNTGDCPVLYLPRDGYLENAAVPGARWYPFSGNFHPSHPVFLGIAPSWSAFIGMGWYPHMVFYGGYWSHSAFVAGGVFLPSIGLSIVIGGSTYHGWDGYHDYYIQHRPAYVFGFHGGPGPGYHEFRGAGPVGDHAYGRSDDHGGPGGDHSFGRPDDHGGPGGDHSFGGDHAVRAHAFHGTRDQVRGGHDDHGGHGDQGDHHDH